MMFGNTGWLFADLMLAIAMAFLVANTVGAHNPPHKRHPPPRTKEVCNPPALNRTQPVKVPLEIDPTGLASDTRSAVATVSQQVKSTSKLLNQRAGFVIIYTGNEESSDYALTVDGYIKKVLTGLGQQKFVFDGAVYLDEQLLQAPPTQAQLEVYLFEPQKCHAEPVLPANGGG